MGYFWVNYSFDSTTLLLTEARFWVGKNTEKRKSTAENIESVAISTLHTLSTNIDRYSIK